MAWIIPTLPAKRLSSAGVSRRKDLAQLSKPTSTDRRQVFFNNLSVQFLLEYGPATQGNDRLSDLMRQKIPWKIDIEKCLSDRYPAANIAWKFEHLQAGRNSKLQAEVEKKGVTDSCFLAAHETFRKYLIACGNLEK